MIRLAIMAARYYLGRLGTPAWLVRRRRRRVGQLSMICACGEPAIAWLTGWWWGRREFCGGCLVRRHRRRRLFWRAVMWAALAGALVETVVGVRR